MTKSIIYLYSFLVLTGCFANYGNSETVLHDGESLLFNSKEGPVHILAKNNGVRIIDFRGNVNTVKLNPRYKRWYGSLGLYAPSCSWKDSLYKRAILEEGQMHFDSDADAIKWVEKKFAIEEAWSRGELDISKKSKYLYYTNKGLVIIFTLLKPTRRALKEMPYIHGVIRLEMWQIKLNNGDIPNIKLYEYSQTNMKIVRFKGI